MAGVLKPQVLLADSSLLFAKGPSAFLGPMLAEQFDGNSLTAAYLGAANGDQPEYFEIFEAAMAGVGIGHVKMIRQEFPVSDREWLKQADVIVLAGGDIALGWEVFSTTGIREILQERFLGGAMLIGISAGAVHLCRQGWRKEKNGSIQGFDTLGYVPFLIDCHDEANDWKDFRQRLASANSDIPGLGLPFGGGLIYYPHGEAQPIGKPLVEFRKDPETGSLREGLLYPMGKGHRVAHNEPHIEP